MEKGSLFTPEEYKKNFKKNTKGKKEESVQIAICNYIKLRYPDVIFTCDLASGMKLPIWIVAKHKAMRSSRGLPDLFIAKSGKEDIGKCDMMGNNLYKLYNGLFLELKKDGVSIYKKDGTLKKDEHLEEQTAILERLRKHGYKAEFAVGFEEAVKIIDAYLQ